MSFCSISGGEHVCDELRVHFSTPFRRDTSYLVIMTSLFACSRARTDGEVWAANERLRDGERGEKVAIKKINNCFVQATEAKRILRELRILRHLSHPNVVRIRDVLDPTNELNYSDLWVVFDFVDLDLRKLIASPQTITVQHVQWISHQVCAGNSVEPSQPAVRCL